MVPFSRFHNLVVVVVVVVLGKLGIWLGEIIKVN